MSESNKTEREKGLERELTDSINKIDDIRNDRDIINSLNYFFNSEFDNNKKRIMIRSLENIVKTQKKKLKIK